MEVADLHASWSKDPSTKVGAVIVNSDRVEVGHGYNGFPRGVDDDWTRYADRPTKYSLVVHAELNAILNANGSVRGCTLYITAPACSECAKAIIQSGISRVVWRENAELSARWAGSMEATLSMFDEAGIDFETIED